MSKKFYWAGNIAKTRVIDEILNNCCQSESVTVFDLGCGDGGDWPRILDDNPHISLIGYEPYLPSLRKAQQRLAGRKAQLLGRDGVQSLKPISRFVVSFSVLEHVVAKHDFLDLAKSVLAPDGIFYLNYDDGHFRNVLDLSLPSTWLAAFRTRTRTLISGPLATLGVHSHYQKRVAAADVNQMISAAGFLIERDDYHNLASLKELAKSMPEHLQQSWMAWWLETERKINSDFRINGSHERFGDTTNLWAQMPSRTLVLKHS